MMNQASPPMIDVLPPEILSAVFALLRQTRRYRQLLPFQVQLSHVCRHWRQVALSTPQLWSTISIFSSESQLCTNEWLTRSCTVPLDVRLDLYKADCRGVLTPGWIGDNLSLIAQNADRIRSLFLITVKEVNVYHTLELFRQADAPLLERLRVHVGSHEHSHHLSPFVDPESGFTLATTFRGDLPRLTFVELKALRCIPPLTNVTTLHLNLVGSQPAEISFNRLVEILQLPQNLITLSLRGNVATDGWPPQRDRSHITLPKLRNLELSSNGATGVCFLIFFAIPELKSLRWHVYSDSYHLLLESPQFQTGSSKFPSLKYLTLVSQSLTPQHLQRLMRIFPTPTHILCSHALAPRTTFQYLDSLLDAPCLEVLAMQRVFEPRTEVAIRDLRGVLIKRPGIKFLVDTTLLAYIDSHDPELRSTVELDEINEQSFPDYWLISRSLDTPDRL
ncbi:hypothetical protein NP233_g4505 [Leucocoprinus birnbaumii]|uniref:F-box domain-containing protein n=1 Tax=Leucocoprinus birnbaumii TaxID=56174 RepID=A0AAD5VXA0_9AGAR|nr:hypothetical protein NP233_g4505 [Leucocoprinus birnbaumii]